MTFTYNDNIPDALNNPSQDQPKMKANTNSIDSLINVDHVSFNQANGGYHKVVHILNNGGNPGQLGGLGQLFTNLTGGEVNLYYESDLGNVTQLTNNAALGTNGIIVLGKLTIEWGQVNPATSGTPIIFPRAFSGTPYSIQITVKDNNTNHRAFASYNTASTTQFIPILLSSNGNPETDNIAWIAIGPT